MSDQELAAQGGWAFLPGIYEHYKGGHYAALMIVAHHETREPMVVYTSLEKGNVQVREWRQRPKDMPYEHVRYVEDDGFRPEFIDAWTDVIEWPDGSKRPRFKFLRSFS